MGGGGEFVVKIETPDMKRGGIVVKILGHEVANGVDALLSTSGQPVTVTVTLDASEGGEDE